MLHMLWSVWDGWGGDRDEGILDDDDEIMLALAEALGQLVPAVGGPVHAALLLPR